MKNYERYGQVTSEQYDRKTIMSYICRMPSDRKLIPILSGIRGKRVLEVGLGTGYYTKVFLRKDNEILGVDRHPHLCRMPVKVLEGDATELEALVGDDRFDVVFSGWMTEYLSPSQLLDFFRQSRRVLRPDGQLISTMISRHGLGYLYTTLAKSIRGTDKYGYRMADAVEPLRQAGFNRVETVNLCSWLGIPWAFLVIARP